MRSTFLLTTLGFVSTCLAQVVESPCTATTTNSSAELAAWMQCAISRFYPYPANGNWSAAYDELFSPNILASFNSTKYDYEGYRSYFGRVNATIAVSFKVFDWKILSAVAVPNSNDEKSGLVFLTGRQGGRTARDTDIQFSNGAFAVVEDIGNGTRKIVELREASNTPSSVPNSGDDQWSCAGTLLPEFLGGI